MKNTAIYIHIPFCDHKCIYCDFYSIITSDNISSYKTALLKEIDHYANIYTHERNITSIYFGGGTPSLMEPQYLNEIITSIKDNFNVNESAEISMETNPGTVSKDKLKEFRNAGINRISIGIQSFNEDELKFLTRIHDKDTAIKTVHHAANSGFTNISIDLIFNLPGQTKDIWLNNLRFAASLPVNHISAYSLILERGTILNKMVLDGKVKIQDEDYDADLYEMTIDFMEANGFMQYEVSNFAKPGFECIHNNAYWRYQDYLSFGTSAHSFIDGKRWWNYSSLKLYITQINAKGFAEANHELISAEQSINEYTMLALRSFGLDIPDLKERFGKSWLVKNSQYLRLLEEKGMLVKNGSFLKLTKHGYAVCDEIIAKFI
jgi:oxygen-independent coproporphyrinogen-3 oxidase